MLKVKQIMEATSLLNGDKENQKVEMINALKFILQSNQKNFKVD